MWSFLLVFGWFLDFLLEILKSKRKICDDVHWNVWTNIKTLCDRNTIFKKKNSKYEILNHFYFGPNFLSFFGTALGCFLLSTPSSLPTSCYNTLRTVILKTFAEFCEFQAHSRKFYLPKHVVKLYTWKFIPARSPFAKVYQVKNFL